MKVVLIYIIFFILFAFPTHGQTKETVSVPQRKVIVARGGTDYPPFEFINENGEPDGFNVELFKAVMNVIGISYKIELKPWETSISEVRNDKADALVGMIYSSERAAQLKFCVPHCTVNRNIISRKEDNYTTLESIKGKEIIVQQGGWSHKYALENSLTSKLIVVKSMQEALELLNSGKFDAAIGSDLVALSTIKDKSFHRLKIHPMGIESQTYSIVVNKNNEILLKLINMGLQELKVSGEYDRIYNKWFGVYSENSPQSETIYFILILTISIAVLSLLIVHILRVKIKKATKDLKYLNLDLQLTLKAGEISAWKYNTKTQEFHALHGDTIIGKGMNLKEFMAHLHSKDAMAFMDLMDELSRGTKENASITIRHKGDNSHGDYTYYHSEMIVERDRKKNIQHIVGTQQDITSRHRTEAEREEAIVALKMAIKAASLWVWYYDIEQASYFAMDSNSFIKVPNADIEQNIHPDDFQSYMQILNELIEEKEESASDTFRYKNPTGGYNYYETCFIAVKNTAWKTYRIAINQRDITKKHLRKLEIDSARKSLDMAINGILLTAWEYNIKTKEYRILYGKDIGLQKDISLDYLCPDDRVEYHEYIRQILDGEKDVNSMIVRIIKDDGFRYFESNTSSVKNKTGEIISLVGSYKDITQQKESELIIIEKQRELEIAKEKAERSDVLKSAFLANMSHEIRTPLNAIVGFSGLIIETDDDKERNEYARIVNTNNELLLKLINDILDLSKIESGYIELKREKADFAKLFEDIAATIRPRIPENIEFICEHPYDSCIAEFDKDRATQVITNFLTNAIKFTPNGTIRMGYECRNDGLEFFISDTGIGIAQENIPKIFVRFEKINSFTQGTGLGISICKAIIDTVGGTIKIDSEPGKGSTFRVWIPFKPMVLVSE